MPIALNARPCTASGGRIAWYVPAIRDRNAPEGRTRCTRTVCGSTTCTLSMMASEPLPRAAVFGSRMRSSENFTSLAVSARPLWNFTFFRSANVHCLAVGAETRHDSARTGRILRSRSKSTRPWKTRLSTW